MSNDMSDTFGGPADRATYLLGNSPLVLVAAVFTFGAILWIYRPSIPQVPPVVVGMLATVFLFGPGLFVIFVVFVRRLRQRRMVTVHHINGVTDSREKYYVEPKIWNEKTVDGPSPYPVNDGSAFEVREFDWQDGTDTLVVRGTYFSQLADSKLITIKAMLEDIHGDLVEEYLAANRLRGRISKMGLQIQKDVVNEEAQADERGLMNPKTAVKDRFDSARDDAHDRPTDGIEDVHGFVNEYADEHGIEATDGPPATPEQARADGGEP